MINTTNFYGAATFPFSSASSLKDDIFIRASKGFLDGIPEVNAVSDLRIKMVKYIARPFLQNPDTDKYLDSPVVTVEIMDVLTNKLDVNISKRNELKGNEFFEIYFPYTPMKG